MKKLFAISCLFLFSLITNLTSAQQWTDKQKDVLKTVKAYSDLIASNNWTEFNNYFDDSYWGWHFSSLTPGNKANLINVNNLWIAKGKVPLYRITPLKVWVSGDFAFVHYTFSETYEMNGEKIIAYVGHWTDILIKKDGKWLIVGHQSGSTIRAL